MKINVFISILNRLIVVANIVAKHEMPDIMASAVHVGKVVSYSFLHTMSRYENQSQRVLSIIFIARQHTD